jgi:Cu+-exporting ATPase
MARSQPAQAKLTEWTFPVQGMTCASCVGRVERALSKVAGVRQVSVNLATEAVTLSTDGKASGAQVMAAVRGAGYQVPPRQVELAIGGMTCASCVGRVEKALAAVPGVLSASVNLATERATVASVPGVDEQALIQAVERAGYEAAPTDGGSAVPEGGRRRHDWWPVAVAAVLSLPLALPMLAEPLGVHWMLPGWVHAFIAPAGTLCERAPATWTCWWRSAPLLPTA